MIGRTSAREPLSVVSAPAPIKVAIIGGGPVGCVTALAFAHKGARVLMLEGNPPESAGG